MNVRAMREPLLFGVVLVVLGGWTWLDLGDRYVGRRPNTARALELPEFEPVARVEAGELRAPIPGTRERSAFAPPRELLPLDPLVLPDPPQPPLSVRRPATRPSMRGAAATAYRVPADAVGGLELSDDIDAGAEVVPEVREALATDEVAEATSRDPDADAMRDQEASEARFDWVVRADTTRRLYGRILNEDPHGLAGRLGEDITFQQVSSATGRPIGAPFVIERDEVIEFALARTFENLYIARSRSLGTGLGSLSGRRNLSLEMLDAWPEQPRALEFARAEAERALEAAPDDPGAARLLATVLRRAGDLEGELAVYVEARERATADAPLLAGYARLARELGLTERAWELVGEARRASGTLGEAAVVEGLLLRDAGRDAEALEALRTAETLPFAGPQVERQRAELGLRIAETALALGRLDEAAREANRLLLDRDDDVDAMIVMGAVHAARGELDEAAELFDGAMAADPSDARAIANAGIVAWRQRDGDLARRLLERAIDVDPFRALAPQLALGFVYEDAGRPETARDLYAAALRLEPAAPDALYRYGRNQRLDGDPAGASDTLGRALRLAGPEVLLLAELGRAAADLGLHEEARRYAREALRLAPGDGEMHWILGLSALADGDILAAIEPLEAAAAAGMPGAHNGLAICAYVRGDAEGALDHFDAVERAYAGRLDDPQAAFAVAQAAAIRDNLAKRQWRDEFCRTSLQRGWTEHVWDGSPRVWLDDCAVRVEGRMEKPREDERPGLSRALDGAAFFSVDALVESLGSDGRHGVTLTYRQVRGARGRLPKARLEIWIDEDGAVRLSTLDNFDTVGLDGAPLDGVRVASGTPVRLGIERTDATAGHFRFLVDGRRVGPEVEIKSLRNFRNPFELAIWADAAPGRSAGTAVREVRIVRTP